MNSPRALWLAAQHGQTGNVREWLRLAEQEAQHRNVQLQGIHVKRALTVAVTNDHADTILCLLQSGHAGNAGCSRHDVRHGEDTLMQLLHCAVVSGSVSAVRVLIAFGVQRLRFRDKSSKCFLTRTLVHRAIDNTQPEILAHLAREQGMDLNQRLVPLHRIVQCFHLCREYSPLDLAVRGASYAARGILFGQYADHHMATVKALLRHKACVNARSEDSKLLRVACSNRDGPTPHAPPNRHTRRLVRLLVRAKADVDALDSSGKQRLALCL